jgi:hypothetical protein
MDIINIFRGECIQQWISQMSRLTLHQSRWEYLFVVH